MNNSILPLGRSILAKTQDLILVSIIIGGVALPLVTQAEPPRYRLVDLGSFGGPQSTVNGGSQILTSSGTLVGAADTAVADPNFGVANYGGFLEPNPFIEHAFQWRNGIVTDLGALPGLNSSYAFGANAVGDVVGFSENGLIDPLTGTPEVRAVLWRDSKIIDLGRLGGNESQAADINNTNSRLSMGERSHARLGHSGRPRRHPRLH